MANKDALKKAPDTVFNKYSIEQVIEALKLAGFGNVEHHTEKDILSKQRNKRCTTLRIINNPILTPWLEL